MNNCSAEGNEEKYVTRLYLYPDLLKARHSYKDKKHAVPSTAGAPKVDD